MSQEQEEHCQMLKAKCTDIEYDAEISKEQEVQKRKPLRPGPPRVKANCRGVSLFQPGTMHNNQQLARGTKEKALTQDRDIKKEETKR